MLSLFGRLLSGGRRRVKLHELSPWNFVRHPWGYHVGRLRELRRWFLLRFSRSIGMRGLCRRDLSSERWGKQLWQLSAWKIRIDY